MIISDHLSIFDTCITSKNKVYENYLQEIR